jgi:glutathione peroxidase
MAFYHKVLGFFIQLAPSSSGDLPTSIYDFEINTLEGKVMPLAQFAGKPLMMVNVASQCSYVPQYGDLQKLYHDYANKISIVGFPANDFLGQEPGSDSEIASFCQLRFGVTFPMSKKISVAGRHRHPIYQWLYQKTGRKPSWNFCKYLIDKSGKNVKFYSSDVNPLDAQILKEIEGA